MEYNLTFPTGGKTTENDPDNVRTSVYIVSFIHLIFEQMNSHIENKENPIGGLNGSYGVGGRQGYFHRR